MAEKLCKDCDYYHTYWGKEACVAQSSVRANRVTGISEYLSYNGNPGYSRSIDDDLFCGPGAQFFKTKPSLWLRLRRLLSKTTPSVRW